MRGGPVMTAEPSNASSSATGARSWRSTRYGKIRISRCTRGEADASSTPAGCARGCDRRSDRGSGQGLEPAEEQQRDGLKNTPGAARLLEKRFVLPQHRLLLEEAI